MSAIRSSDRSVQDATNIFTYLKVIEARRLGVGGCPGRRSCDFVSQCFIGSAADDWSCDAGFRKQEAACIAVPGSRPCLRI